MTIAELWCGVLEKRAGKRRWELGRWFAGPERLQVPFATPEPPFDQGATFNWARLMADGMTKGRPRCAPDIIIAAVAATNDGIMVTDNERDFGGMKDQ